MTIRHILVPMPMTPEQERIYRLLSSGIAYTDADGSYYLRIPLSAYQKDRAELSRRRILKCISQRGYNEKFQAPKFVAVGAKAVAEAA